MGHHLVRHIAPATGTVFAVVNAVTDALPHLASAAAVFSGFAAGCYYLHKIITERRRK
jgi:hypothetical protein